mgnify:CR=1 FL=1
MSYNAHVTVIRNIQNCDYSKLRLSTYDGSTYRERIEFYAADLNIFLAGIQFLAQFTPLCE